MPNGKRTRTTSKTTDSSKAPKNTERKDVKAKKAMTDADRKAAVAAKLAVELLQLATTLEPITRSTPAVVGARADTNFYATFLRSGQGDCIVFKTPGGKTVLVDCGSTTLDTTTGEAHAQYIWNSLNVPRYLLGSSTIDVMVFTHPDEDHYNYLTSVLDEDRTGRKMTVGRVYHSGDSQDYVGAIDWLRKHMADATKIFKVVHNLEVDPSDQSVVRGEITLDGTAVVAATAGDQVDRLDDKGGIRIIAEPTCTVTILAGGVAHDYKTDKDTKKARNRASLVLLIEAHGKKLLLCGDATTSTEHYLIAAGKYAAPTKTRITGVDVMHIAHHGSKVTSGSKELLDVVKPKTEAIISAAREGSTSHHLPAWPTVEKYIDNFTGRVPATAHKGWCWDMNVSRYKVQQMDIPVPVYITGSHGNLDIAWTA
ncbi:ComEC/Rec2 family competence protein [Verrucosispora sp. NA02020]|uniref:ComEC/Rec2 family competence protein n=1 Tax=Verrucosispora sp. NA02020 TaxID=2742132 RepID=UPI003D751C88